MNATKDKVLAGKLNIEYPREGEKISAAAFTFRIDGPRGDGHGAVEISIDGGPFTACRNAAGRWWYDWNGHSLGEHQAAVRVRLEAGETLLGGPRKFYATSDGGLGRAPFNPPHLARFA